MVLLLLLFTDCLECMACSDNVVRAGLTPKFKDIDTLCSMLDYAPGPVERFACNWTDEDEYCQVSIPPVPDFAMARLRLPVSATATDGYRLPSRPNASILLILQGRGLILNDDSKKLQQQLRAGQILFLKAGQSMNPIRVVQDDDDEDKAAEDLVIYQAFANVWTMAFSTVRPRVGISRKENLHLLFIFCIHRVPFLSLSVSVSPCCCCCCCWLFRGFSIYSSCVLCRTPLKIIQRGVVVTTGKSYPSFKSPLGRSLARLLAVIVLCAVAAQEIQ